MEKGIIGRKVGMTQLFTEAGKLVPVTVLEAGPCVVTQKKTVDNDGYEAVQLGFDDVREKLVTKPAQPLLHQIKVLLIIESLILSFSFFGSSKRKIHSKILYHIYKYAKSRL